ncbi:MAG: 30S ribosomal protein S9 [Anaerolineae bacterium]|nr:30S ribosomal protein S9 [Anaerolineae bacterium]
MEYYEAVGRRKTATARVRLYPGGSGIITVNDRPVEEYFVREMDIAQLKEPLKVTAMEHRFNISIKVRGGGIGGQSGAAALGISRALLKVHPELRDMLRKGGFLTCDARVKERKKPGLKRARKAPQYTKR